MAYDESTSPDVTESLPFDISSVASAYPVGAGWDVTFNDLGFLLRPTPEYPYRRETDAVSKEQIDTSGEAGEQSLSRWWIRSQASWHLGAGVKWYEPKSDRDTEYRFDTSYGVDPWTVGEVKLLRRCEAIEETASLDPVYVSTFRTDGVDGHLAATGDVVYWAPDDDTEVTDDLAGSGATQPAIGGGFAWIGHSTGVAKFDPATSTVSEPLTASGGCRAWWVKSRLIVAAGPTLYELTAADTGAVETVGTELYTHPDAAWVWADVAEVGEAIIVAGHGEAESAIYRMTIDNDDTGMPRLSGASQVAQMPPGEEIRMLGVYLGTYLVLGTTSGARVGLVSASGEVQYGPLTIETAEPVVDVTFRDRFAFVVVTAAQPDGATGAARIDLSAPIGETGRFAWAWDASTGTTGEASSLCFVGRQDRLVIAAGGRRYVQSATDYVDTGVLTGGRIRFSTVEPKAFRLARLIATLNGGAVNVTAIAPDDSQHRVYDYTSESATSGDVGIKIPGRDTNQFLAFRFTLTPTIDLSASPVVQGFSVKAFPAPTRMRLVQYPISVFDHEITRSGQRRGVTGGALARVHALERLEDTATPVTIRHLSSGDSLVGMVESVSFSSAAPPDRNQSGFGGVALVTVRKL